MSTSFQTFSPSYENISNRMSRLKHHSQNHHSQKHHNNSYLTVSPPKTINLLNLDTNIKTRYNHRVSPTAYNLREELGNIGKFTGRVTKNVGLKKYNQRQIKEVMNNREPNQLRTEGNSYHERQNPRLCTQGSAVKEVGVPERWPVAVAGRSRIDEVKMNDSRRQSVEKVGTWQSKLVPGRMYKREYLMEILKN